jgi:iron complex outermembrane receptor protein
MAVAVAASVAGAGTLLAVDVSARAQSPAAEQAQADRSATFNIPAQPLVQALTALGQQSGLQVAVSAPAVAGKTSTAVSGVMTAEQALRLLLSGTGVGYRFTSPNVVTISGAPDAGSAVQLDPVQVQGYPVPPQATIDNLPPPYAGGQVATGGQLGVLGERNFMDTPFNQTSYTSKLMTDQQARSIADVVANDPSVRNMFPAASYTSPLFVRGFDVSNYEFAFNGMYNVGPAVLVSPAYLERVEVLKGPSVLLNGMPPFGGIGGAVNLVPKRAGNEELNQVTASYVSNAQFGGHFDFARRFGDNQSFGFRFNGVYRNGDTPVDRQTQEVAAAVFGFDFRGERVRASLDYGYQKQRYNSPLQFTFVAAGVPVPLAPGGRSNWFQPWSYVDTNEIFGLARAEFDITPDWTAYGAVGGRNTRWDAARAIGNSVTNSAGSLTQSVRYRPSWEHSNTEEIGIRGRAETGPVRHALSLSGTRTIMEQGFYDSLLATIQSNLYQPTFVNRPNIPAVEPPKTNSTELSSLVLADILSAVDERVQLILGARLQRVQSKGFSNITGAVTSYYDQTALSPAFALVVKPWENVSIYGNYIQGLQQGPTAPASALNAGEIFAPAVSKQFEVGAKADFGSFATTLSLFQIERPFGFTDPTTAIFGVGGMQRNQGLEWTLFGEPLAGFRALGGATLMNGRLVNTASPLTSGMKAPGVPDVQLNLGAEWDAPFLRGLTFSSRVIYTSLQYLDQANTQSIPAWTRFDAGVRYVFDRKDGRPVALRFNVENLFDLNYWAASNASFGLSMGAPRTFLLSLTADF